MSGVGVFLIVIGAGITLSALVGIWIGKGLCALSEWNDDDNESGSNPL